MKFYKIFIIVIYIIISSLFTKIEAQEEGKASSQLVVNSNASPEKNKTETKIKIYTPLMNMHNSGIKCNECHKKEAIEGIDTPSTIELIESEINKLCEKCHKGDNLHPVGVDPQLVKIPVKIPAFLPLGLNGQEKGKIVCTTCHLIHADDAADKLLRGFARTFLKGKPLSSIPFKERRDMCRSCHEKEFIEKSPHSKEQGKCVYCHTSDPNKADDVTRTYAKDFLRLCTFCHEKITDSHYEKSNPFKDEELKEEIKKASFFMLDSSIVCSTCHDPHGQTTYPKALRENFINVAEKSKHTNPHWKGFYCMSCHEKPPQEGQKAVIRFNGNINYTCMWCHGVNPTSWADVHPVNVEVITSEIMKVPKEFPLVNNKLTCITCHDPRMQIKMDKEIYRENKQFLRVTTYSPTDNRSKSCFQCHIQQQFDMLNAHDQIDDQGEMVEDSCKYCHIATPDRMTEGLQNIDPNVTNLSALCFRCHSDGPHPGKVTHLMKIPSEKLSRKVIYEKKYDVVYPLDGKGDIFCATCHNPHEIGIVKSLRANKGADADRRARLPIARGFLCYTCHDKDKDASLQQFMTK